MSPPLAPIPPSQLTCIGRSPGRGAGLGADRAGTVLGLLGSAQGREAGRECGGPLGFAPPRISPLVEASHLLHEGDTAKDRRPNKAEILGTWTTLVASQASNHAEELTRHHAEPEPRERGRQITPRADLGRPGGRGPTCPALQEVGPNLCVPCALHAGEYQRVNFTP